MSVAERVLAQAEQGPARSLTEIKSDYDVLYNFWLMGLPGFGSFEQFIEHHRGDSSPKTVGNFLQSMDLYMRFAIIRQRRMREPKSYMFDPAMTLPGTLYHATGSAALEGIARHKAIMSSRKVLEVGEVIKTGEHITVVHAGLEAVYTTRCFSSDYCLARWFNECHVVFGIKEGAAPLIADKAYTLIGPEVPLRELSVVHTEDVFQDKMSEWLKANNIDIPIEPIAYVT